MPSPHALSTFLWLLLPLASHSSNFSFFGFYFIQLLLLPLYKVLPMYYNFGSSPGVISPFRGYVLPFWLGTRGSPTIWRLCTVILSQDRGFFHHLEAPQGSFKHTMYFWLPWVNTYYIYNIKYYMYRWKPMLVMFLIYTVRCI